MSLTPRADNAGKNYLMNGAMDFTQRDTAAVNMSGTLNYQTVDRWRVAFTGAMTGTPTSQRIASSPNTASKYALEFISRRNASVSSLNMQQRVEASNARELAGSTVSLSVYVKPETATTVRLILETPTVEDDFSSLSAAFYDQTRTVTADSSWQKVQFNGISVSSATNLGLSVKVQMESVSGTDGSTTSHSITQVAMMQKGKEVDFARAGRNITEELQFCQRYYERSQAGEFFYNLAQASGSQVQRLAIEFAVEKRTNIPTITYAKISGVANIGPTAGVSTRAVLASFTGAAGTVINFDWTVDAEL